MRNYIELSFGYPKVKDALSNLHDHRNKKLTHAKNRLGYEQKIQLQLYFQVIQSIN